MTLSEWVLENMVSRMLIRMRLSRTRDSFLGLEQVHASLVGYHYDDDGSVFAEFTYSCSEGSNFGRLEYSVTADQTLFVAHAREVAAKWESADVKSWSHQIDKVFWVNISTRGVSEITNSASNILVLQHLARIQGVIAGRANSPRLGVDERAVFHTSVNRLGSVIRLANIELNRLTLYT